MATSGTGEPKRRLHPALRPFVSSLTAYDLTGSEPGVHAGLPSTNVTLILPLDEPVDLAWSTKTEDRSRLWSCVSGLHTEPVHVRHGTSQRGIHIALSPVGVRTVLGVPASAIATCFAELEDITPAIRHLPAKLHETGTWTDRLALVEQQLLCVLRRSDEPDPRTGVELALKHLARGSSVHETAEAVGYHRRHLVSLIRRECGVTPKQYQRLARFERSRAIILAAAADGEPLVTAALRAGYADQAHMTREWNEYAGQTPGTWLQHEFPNVQDGSH